MSVQVRRRRESASFLASFVGAQSELIVDTTNNRVQVHDGTTPGGWPAAKLSEVVTNTRTVVADASYSVLATDRTIAVTSLTAPRTITLPAASAYPTGTQLLIFDESGACSTTNTISVARVGTDTINGTTAVLLTSPYGYLALESNGGGRWTVVDQTVPVVASTAVRTPVADANYTASTSDRLIGYTSISAPRIVTLPSASAFPVGTRLLVLDESGSASGTSTITLARTGSDTINGAASAVISTAYGYFAVQSNGGSKWTITDQPSNASAVTASRTAIADANYTALVADRLIAYTSLTTSRTITLPAASAYPTGIQLFVVDESGACSATNTIAIARAGTDTINGAASTSIGTAYGYLALESNGSGKWTVVDQTPGTSGTAAPRSAVRQTVQSGPQSSGAPSFLPSTSSSLILIAQNVSTGTNALTIAAAQGFNASGQNDVIYQVTSNPTWSGLTASATNYLYVNASSGTTGSTTLAPIYQSGGAISVTNGQFTFDKQAMIGYLGNGTSAAVSLLVFVGQATTSASAVTATVAYAYNGTYVGPWTQNLPGLGTVISNNDNIGLLDDVLVTLELQCTTADTNSNYAVGATVTNGLGAYNSANNVFYALAPYKTSANTCSFVTGASAAAVLLINATTGGGPSNLTQNNWKYRLKAKRWGAP